MGQINFKLCNITLRFMELNAFSASIKRYVSNGMENRFSTSILTCTKLQRSSAFVTSFLHNIITTLPVILLSTSPTQIGLKPGYFSNGINLLAVKASRDYVDCSSSEQSFLRKFAKTLRRSLDEFPICLEFNTLLQPSASRNDGPEPSFVNIAARITKEIWHHWENAMFSESNGRISDAA